MPPISPRKELLGLQKKIYRNNKQIIQDSVIHQDKSFKTYENRYKRAVSKYRSISSFEEMDDAMMEANLILVGDYHTLNQSQRSFLRLLRRFAQRTTNFSIGLEVIQARHQEYLNKYMEGKVSDQTFLKKIGFQEHWFFDLWDNFRPIFDFARYHQVPIHGVEADPSVGTSLKKRDEETARLLFEVFREEPERKFFIFIGDLHLAPQHLPRELIKIFKKNKIPVKIMTLYQNSEAIYWQLAEKEVEDKTFVVKISEKEFCRMHTPPIISQQSYLNWLQHEGETFDFADAKQTFIDYLERIASFLGIELGPEKDEVEVFTCGDLSFLKKIRESGAFSKKELREIKRQILRSESYYIPKLKIAYIANVSINHAAEEAAHTLRNLCAGEEFPRPMQDAFYANILHEGLGFFGSKIINHRRKCFRPGEFKKLIHYLESHKEAASGRGLEYQISTLFLEHEKKAKKKTPFHSNKIKSLSVDQFLGVTHALGYYMGDRLFYGLLDHHVSKEFVRHLHYDQMEEEGDPVKRYFEIQEKLRGVKLPKRL